MYYFTLLTLLESIFPGDGSDTSWALLEGIWFFCLKNQNSFLPKTPTLPVPSLPYHCLLPTSTSSGFEHPYPTLPSPGGVAENLSSKTDSPFQRKSLHVMLRDTLQRAEEGKAQRLSKQSSHIGVQLGLLPGESLVP